MAPALTQSSESPTFVDVRYSNHNSDDIDIYDLKLKNKRKIAPLLKKIFSKEKGINSSNSVPPGLAPPASGWAEGYLNSVEFVPHSNMDNNSTTTHENSTVNSIPNNSEILLTNNMGLQSRLDNISLADEAPMKGSEAAIPMLKDSFSNSTELMALVNQDFGNVNEIIDTLQHLASNPELIDAAARDLEPQQTQNNLPLPSQNESKEVKVPTVTDSQKSIGSKSSLDNSMKEFLTKLTEQQRRLEKKRKYLVRRVRRLTSKGLHFNASNQIKEMLKSIRSSIEKPKVETERFGLEMLQEESMKSMSTSNLISLVRKVEADNNVKLKSEVASEIGSLESIPSSICTEIKEVIGEFKCKISDHNKYDSEATDSSSEEGSCDENEPFNYFNIESKPIRDRALYKFNRERSWVASKWMWLDAQIHDLDFKISQHESLLEHIRNTKGPVKLCEDNVLAKTSAADHLGSRLSSPAHLNMQDPALTCLLPPSSRPVLNGFHPTHKIDDLDCNFSQGCARTQGVEKVKRRRYIKPGSPLKRTMGNNSRGRNVKNVNIKHSSVQCSCVSNLSCIICVKSRNYKGASGSSFLNWGRNKFLGVNKKSLLRSQASRVDHKFHPSLSKDSDILQGQVLNSGLKSFKYKKNRVSNTKPSNSLKNSVDGQEPAHKKKKSHKNSKRRFSKDEKKNKTRRGDHSDERKSLSYNSDDEEVECMTTNSSSYSSPCPSPAPHGNDAKFGRKAGGFRQKTNSTSYDINNIVIPYSMSTRVEHLHYKEITTPEWRIVELEPLNFDTNQSKDVEEDLNEEAMIARHGRSQAAERKRFLSCLKMGIPRGVGRPRRTDSSGTNTPEHPLSPRPIMESAECLSTISSDTAIHDVSEDSNQSTSTAPSTALNFYRGGQTSGTSSNFSKHSNFLSISVNNSISGGNKELLPSPPVSVLSKDSGLGSPGLPSTTDGLKERPEASSLEMNGHSKDRSERYFNLPKEKAENTSRHRRTPSFGKVEKNVEFNDLKLPFPSREFPLNEHEYLGLVFSGQDNYTSWHPSNSTDQVENSNFALVPPEIFNSSRIPTGISNTSSFPTETSNSNSFPIEISNSSRNPTESFNANMAPTKLSNSSSVSTKISYSSMTLNEIDKYNKTSMTPTETNYSRTLAESSNSSSNPIGASTNYNQIVNDCKNTAFLQLDSESKFHSNPNRVKCEKILIKSNLSDKILPINSTAEKIESTPKISISFFSESKNNSKNLKLVKEEPVSPKLISGQNTSNLGKEEQVSSEKVILSKKCSDFYFALPHQILGSKKDAISSDNEILSSEKSGVESFQNSPLSESTDSASENQDIGETWDDKSCDWTISAVKTTDELPDWTFSSVKN